MRDLTTVGMRGEVGHEFGFSGPGITLVEIYRLTKNYLCPFSFPYTITVWRQSLQY